jgi:hypothetical protein
MKRVLIALMLFVAVARAQDARPWAAGVSEERQAEALRLYKAASAYFTERKYAEALAIFRQAIASWDHPAIRHGMALALIHLDQPLAAYVELERALRYGDAPHKPQIYAEALTYEKLLLGQLARLRIACREPAAHVLLDGEEVLTGPGEVLRVLMPGPHQLVALKSGHITATQALTLTAGRETDLAIDLAPVPPPVRTERRFRTWIPWTLVGGGAALMLLGLPFQLDAVSRFEDYDHAVSTACPRGCPEATLLPSVQDMKRLARAENVAALALVAAGTAVAVTGVALAAGNQPRPVTVLLGPGSVAVTGAF